MLKFGFALKDIVAVVISSDEHCISNWNICNDKYHCVQFFKLNVAS